MGGHQAQWPLNPRTPVTSPALPSGAGVATGQPDFLGFGIVTPFVRAANDFATGGGVALVKSCVEQILGVRALGPHGGGELRWRTEFGSLLYLLRHRGLTTISRHLAQEYVRDALARWEPRVTVTFVDVSQQGRILIVRVRFSLIAQNVAGNRVTLPAEEVAVEIPLAA